MGTVYILRGTQMKAYDFYNVYAHTPVGIAAPPFISINAVPDGLKFNVRYKGIDGNTGPQGEITLSVEEVKAMIPKLQQWVDEHADNGPER